MCVNMSVFFVIVFMVCFFLIKLENVEVFMWRAGVIGFYEVVLFWVTGFEGGCENVCGEYRVDVWYIFVLF